jgi:O-antigen ligase
MLSIFLWLIVWATRPKRPWSRNLSLQTAFLALCAVSVFYARNNFWAYIGTRTMFTNVVFALAVTWLMSRRRDFILAIWVWVLAIGYQAGQVLVSGGRGSGAFFGDENDVALACCTALPFALQGTLFLSGWKRWASGALMVLFTSAIVDSASRGGFVALVAVAVFGVLVSPHRLRNLAITAAAALVFWAVIPDSYRGEVASIFENKEYDTGDARQFLWRAAWNMWVDHPVAGVGAQNFNWNVGLYQPRDATGRFANAMYLDRDWTMTAAHSIYFTVLSETGLVGSLLFGAIIVGHFSTIRRTRKLVAGHPAATANLRHYTAFYGTGLSMAMVGYLAAGAFLSVAYYPYPWMLSQCEVPSPRKSLQQRFSSLRCCSDWLRSSPSTPSSGKTPSIPFWEARSASCMAPASQIRAIPCCPRRSTRSSSRSGSSCSATPSSRSSSRRR